MDNKEYPTAITNLLTGDMPPSLGDWYAVILSSGQAQQLLSDAQKAMQQAYTRGVSGYEMRILELIACFWLEREVDHLYTSLSAALGGQRQQALLELVYGQLLMSRRLAGAMIHLDSGFKLAADVIEPAVYFELMRRHDLLRNLQPSKQTVPAQSLEVMLNEAKIVQCIHGTGIRIKVPGQQTDTLG